VSLQAQTLTDVLFRAGQALARYERELSAVVMEEHYRQEVRRPNGGTRGYRDLVSDVLMVWVPSESGWMTFRDVFRVDGRDVRDRQQRLERLFVDSPEAAVGRAREIMEESARFNIGDVRRTLNMPAVALLFLHPANSHRLTFEKSGEEAIDGITAWAVHFTEVKGPALIRSNVGERFAQGTFWIDPATGRHLQTRLVVGDPISDVRATITVSYRRVAALGIWAPAEMTEIYDQPRRPSADVIHGVATYTNFRRFQVQVEETVKPPDGA
jgi:hypothetical protein